MGFIERLRQEAETGELEEQVKQAKLVDTEAFHKQRKDQASVFRTESGWGFRSIKKLLKRSLQSQF